MTPSEIRRFCFIIQIFLNYGLDEFIPKIYTTSFIRFWRKILFWLPNRHKNKILGERLRFALQELGPIWIKFGQMLSTRRDLFSSQIIDQLSFLQDKVIPFDGELAKKQIERSMGNIPIETWFDNFNIIPLASASISQVHAARLKANGEEVVIKVIRPDILPIIKMDIKLIYRLAFLISRIFPASRHLRLMEVVREYEKTLVNELNLLRESANAIQFRRNFKNSSMLYIPKIYSYYCRKDMMVMERIYGIPISDIFELKKNGINMKLLAERGVQIFFTQVFRDNFFHADMHPGNIFVSREHPNEPQYIGIDYGVVGSLNKEDKRYLAEIFMAFFNRDYRKIAELHIISGWVSSDTNVEEFEFAIRTVCEPIFEKPLAEISFSYVLFNLFNTSQCFNMKVQPQLILLHKTLTYVEGIGRQLYPQLNLWKTAKPFLESWIQNQTNFSSFLFALKEKIPLWIEKIPEMPEAMYDYFYQNKNLQYSIDKMLCKFIDNQIYQRKLHFLFNICTMLFFIGILLITSDSDFKLISFLLMGSSIGILLVGWKKINKLK